MIRTLKKLSIVDFAKQVGVNKNTVCKIEKGEENISIETIFKFANALDISLYDLLEGKLLENVDYAFAKSKYKTGQRKSRTNIYSDKTYSIGDLDIYLEGTSIVAAIECKIF